METRKNVVAAISVAVNMYVEAEQCAAGQGPYAPPAPAQAEPPGCSFSAWTFAGRQSFMEMRRLWQMRLMR
ncbi:MAG: hypothetical protein AB7W37_07850 [Syntrophobacteraceae bacterium]|jgi:hypothetical protein